MDFAPYLTIPGLAGIHLETPVGHPSVVIFKDIPELTSRLIDALRHLSERGIHQLVFDVSGLPEERRDFYVTKIDRLAREGGLVRNRYVGLTEQNLQGAEPSWRALYAEQIKDSIPDAVASFFQS